MKSLIHYLLSIFFIFLVLNVGCKKAELNLQVDNCDEYNYIDCDTWEPSYSYVFMDFTINNENPYVPFEVYEGKLEEGKLVLTDTSYSKRDSVEMDFDIDYTVKAKYKKGSQTIYAIDMDKAIKWSQDICDSVCWHYIDAEVDLELR